MARSYRHTRIVSLCGDERDAEARQRGNRVYRRAVRTALRRHHPDSDALPLLRECSSKYNWPSDDSKSYLHADADPRLVTLLRK